MQKLEIQEEIERKRKELEGFHEQLLRRTKSKKKVKHAFYGGKKVTEEDRQERLESQREKLEMLKSEKEEREKSIEGITKHKQVFWMMDEEEEDDEYQVAVLDVGMATVKVS